MLPPFLLTPTGMHACLLLSIMACNLSCRGPSNDNLPDTEPRQITVFVVNYPLKYFAERIAGDAVKVVFPVPANVDPAFWKPADSDIRKFQNADLILLSGANYAKWIRNVSLPTSKVVDTSRGFADSLIAIEDVVVHRHGPDGEHAHRVTAMHTWLDPQLAIQQSEAIAMALEKIDPEHRTKFQGNFEQLKSDLQKIDDQLAELMKGYNNEPLLSSRPVYYYLARRCGWNLRHVHWKPNQMPSDEQWSKLESLLEEHPAKVMIWESPPGDEVVQRLGSLDVEVVEFNPCGNIPKSGEFIIEMQRNYEGLHFVRR